MLHFELLHYFLLLIIRCRFEARTILDSLGDALNTRLGFVFMGSFVADRTHFISPLINDCSILGLLASPRMSLVT